MPAIASKIQTPAFKVLEFPATSSSVAEEHAAAMLSLYADPADLHDDLEAGCELIVVVDARSSEAYARGHIPGAISFPHREMDAQSLQRLSKAKLVVTYCDGIGCNASTKAALKLAQHGFRVKELIGGIDWWIRDGYQTVGGNDPKPSSGCGC